MRTLLAATALLALASPAFAHFQEILPSDDVLAEGGKVTVKLEFTHPMEMGPTMDMAKPVRVGVATAWTLAYAAGRTPHGVCSLDVVAREWADAGAPGRFVVAADARRRELYWREYTADGAPVGYIQVWFIADNQDEAVDHPWVAELPRDAVGIDLSIGDPARLSQGLGSAAVAGMVHRLRAEGHRTIIIDPDPANARAVSAYRKAGFRPIPALEGRSGDSLIMQFHPEAT